MRTYSRARGVAEGHQFVGHGLGLPGVLGAGDGFAGCVGCRLDDRRQPDPRPR